MTDKMCEGFEAWYEHPDQAELRTACAKGWAEIVWQASLAAVVVELLPRVTAEECASHLEIDDEGIALDVSHMINGAIIACGGMIKAQGLKVKL